jgi:peptidoglycan biosynthesis protein MviN/MurJ (putative lipid II flippase)
MVREHARDKVHHVRLRLLRGVRLTLFFGVAVGAFLALFGPNLVGFLLQRGAFGSDEVARVGPALSAFALGLAGSVLVIFLARVFQSIDFFRATVWTQATILVSYVALAYPLRETWGLVGLAIAFGIAQMLGAFVAVALAVWRLDVPRAAFVAEAVRPALDRAATVVLVLAGYRVLLELVDVPVALTGVAYVGGSTLLLLALSAALLWTSDWAESRRTVQAVRSLLRRI